MAQACSPKIGTQAMITRWGTGLNLCLYTQYLWSERKYKLVWLWKDTMAKQL